MKKILLTFLLAIAVNAWAGSFTIDLTDKNISVDDAESYFNSWFCLDSDCSFEKIRDYCDEIGMRHQVFQQYYCGTKIEYAKLFVHSKGGFLTSVNGKIMETEQKPEKSSSKLVQSISIAEKSSRDFFNKNRQSFLPEVITVMPKKY